MSGRWLACTPAQLDIAHAACIRLSNPYGFVSYACRTGINKHIVAFTVSFLPLAVLLAVIYIWHVFHPQRRGYVGNVRMVTGDMLADQKLVKERMAALEAELREIKAGSVSPPPAAASAQPPAAAGGSGQLPMDISVVPQSGSSIRDLEAGQLPAPGRESIASMLNELRRIVGMSQPRVAPVHAAASDSTRASEPPLLPSAAASAMGEGLQNAPTQLPLSGPTPSLPAIDAVARRIFALEAELYELKHILAHVDASIASGTGAGDYARDGNSSGAADGGGGGGSDQSSAVVHDNLATAVRAGHASGGVPNAALLSPASASGPHDSEQGPAGGW